MSGQPAAPTVPLTVDVPTLLVEGKAKDEIKLIMNFVTYIISSLSNATPDRFFWPTLVTREHVTNVAVRLDKRKSKNCRLDQTRLVWIRSDSKEFKTSFFCRFIFSSTYCDIRAPPSSNQVLTCHESILIIEGFESHECYLPCISLMRYLSTKNKYLLI